MIFGYSIGLVLGVVAKFIMPGKQVFGVGALEGVYAKKVLSDRPTLVGRPPTSQPCAARGRAAGPTWSSTRRRDECADGR